MFKSSPISVLILVAICAVLGLFLGIMLATPDELSSLAWVGGILCLFFVPFLIRWHHPLTIICWNLPFVVFFLPGKQTVAEFIAGISLAISIMSWTLQKRKGLFLYSPGTTYPIISLALVVFTTMAATGGLHSRSFGSQEWGATRYLYILGAVIGYFALIAHPIPKHRVNLLISLFFLLGTTWGLAVVFAMIPHLRFLLAFYPTEVLQSHGGEYNAYVGEEIQRFVGFYFMAQFFCWFMLMRYGIRGIFNWSHWRRLLIFTGVFLLGLLGGFRSFVIFFFILFFVQFYFERLFRSSLFPIFLAVGLLGGACVIIFSDQLPLTFQRAISFVPGINIDPAARQDAEETLDWRLDIWKAVLPTVPEYLFLGKGYGFNSTDFYIAQIATSMAAMHGTRVISYDNPYLIMGDYHNGPLTLIIPLGIWGALAFAAFCWGGIRALYFNYYYGDSEMKRINTFLLAFFVSKLLLYLTVFGSFYQDLPYFVGIVGISLCVNSGVRYKAPTAPSTTEQVIKLPKYQPA